MDQDPALYRHCINWDIYVRQYHKEIKEFMDQNPTLFHKSSINWKSYLRGHHAEIMSYTPEKYPNIAIYPESFCHLVYDWSEGAFLYFSQNPHLHPINLCNKDYYNSLYGIDYNSFDARQYALDTRRSVKTPKYILINYAYHEMHEHSEMTAYARVIQPTISPASISGDLTSSRGSFLGSLENKLGEQDSIILD